MLINLEGRKRTSHDPTPGSSVAGTVELDPKGPRLPCCCRENGKHSAVLKHGTAAVSTWGGAVVKEELRGDRDMSACTLGRAEDRRVIRAHSPDPHAFVGATQLITQT